MIIMHDMQPCENSTPHKIVHSVCQFPIKFSLSRIRRKCTSQQSDSDFLWSRATASRWIDTKTHPILITPSCLFQVVSKLSEMDDDANLVLSTKKDQADLLTAVLKASDDDADEEVIQPSVSGRERRTIWSLCCMGREEGRFMDSSLDSYGASY